MNRTVWQRRLILAGKIGLAGGLLAWLAMSGRLQLGRLTSVWLDWRFAVLLTLVAGSMIVPAFRWWWLLRIQGLREPVWKIVSLTWAGYLAALVLPGAASGDLARSYLILRRRSQARTGPSRRCLPIGFWGCTAYSALAPYRRYGCWLAAGRGRPFRRWRRCTLTPLAAMTGGLIALLCAPSRRVLFRVLPAPWRLAWNESFAMYRNAVPELLGCFGLSVASSTMTVMSFAVAGRLLGDATTWADSFLAGPLIVVANCLPITPGGIGLAEATSSELFSRLGSAGGAELMLLTRICVAMMSLPGIVALLGLERLV